MRIMGTLLLRTANRLLRRGGGEDRNRHNPEGKKDNDADRNIEIIGIIIGGIDDKELNVGYRKAYIQKLSLGNQRVKTARGTNHDIWSKGHASLTSPSQQCLGDTTQDSCHYESYNTTKTFLKLLRLLLWGSGDKPRIPLEPKDYLPEWAYNVILGQPTLNVIKVVVASYLLLIQFELNDQKVGKLYGEQKMARECYYVSLKSFGRKEEPPIGEMSEPNKTGKRVAIEAMVVLSTLVEEHGRPCSKPTSEGTFVPLDIVCLEGTAPNGRRLGAMKSRGHQKKGNTRKSIVIKFTNIGLE
ncbi:LOW QUALITY PROTEIN: hypothetical protein Cgig2_018470 [Carnegiea gigantea]|uniref:Uncharacterized protein n=1 Tax=Carnegiea gigantea TaxID=171969 RepID=A0A9Q1K842_9CARY|nr:LOW QUALITY PROTEIN: hypothetical protein Cgig2_018470 [Carnegiea gigantea]